MIARLATPKRNPGTIVACLVAAAVSAAMLGGCGTTISNSASGSPASVPTLRSPCTIRPGDTCHDVMAEGGSFDGTVFENMTLGNADFRSANLNSAAFAGSSLQYADFSHAKMVDVGFMNADLTGSKFYGADLTGADFRGANLAGVSFLGATVDGANFSGATMTNTSCVPTAGGACTPTATAPTVMLLAVVGDELDMSVEILGDARGNITKVTLAYLPLTPSAAALPSLRLLKLDDAQTGLNCTVNEIPITDPPKLGDSPKSWDITDLVLKSCTNGSQFTPGATTGYVFVGLGPLAGNGNWDSASAPVRSFVASSKQTNDDANLAFEIEGDEQGVITKATATASALSFAGSVGKASIAVAPPGGSEIDASIDLPDGPGPGEDAKTWDITDQLVAVVGTGQLAAGSTFTAQFYGPDGGGAVGTALSDQWIRGSASTGYQMYATGQSTTKTGSVTANISGANNAAVAAVKLDINPDATLAGTTSVKVSVQVPDGDQSVPDVSVPITVAAPAAQALAAGTAKRNARKKKSTKSALALAAANTQSFDITQAVISKWPDHLLPPHSVVTVSTYTGNGQTPTSSVSGNWLSGEVHVDPGTKVLTDFTKASMVNIALSCFDPAHPRDDISPPVPTAIPTAATAPMPTPTPNTKGYSCANVTGVNFRWATKLTWGKLWGAKLDGVHLSTIVGPSPSQKLDLSWIEVHNSYLSSLSNVRLANATVAASIMTAMDSVDAPQSTITLQSDECSNRCGKITNSSFTGSLVDVQWDYGMENVCLSYSLVNIRGVGQAIKGVDFGGATISELSGATNISNSSFEQASFKPDPSSNFVLNSFDTVSF
ncbi:MAG: pentapeptide repeat-containing protein, partial [Actinomycetes bacterium]